MRHRRPVSNQSLGFHRSGGVPKLRWHVISKNTPSPKDGEDSPAWQCRKRVSKRVPQRTALSLAISAYHPGKISLAAVFFFLPRNSCTEIYSAIGNMLLVTLPTAAQQSAAPAIPNRPPRFLDHTAPRARRLHRRLRTTPTLPRRTILP